MTLSGQSTNGTNRVRLFTVNPGVTLTLSNVAVINGLSTNGGAIWNSGGGRVVLVNCFFSNNVALGPDGGKGPNGSGGGSGTGGNGRTGTNGVHASGGASRKPSKVCGKWP